MRADLYEMLSMTDLSPLITWPELPTPLGQLTFGGELRGGGGTGFRAQRRFGMHALVLLFKGAGMYRDATVEVHPLGPGDVIVVSPDVPHQYGPGPGEHWHELFVCFKGDALTSRVVSLNLPRICHMGEPEHWQRQFIEILERQAIDVTAMAGAASLLHVLLGDIAAAVRGRVSPAWLSAVLTELTSDPGESFRAEDIAKSCGMTYATLRRQFKAVTGSSLMQERRLHQLRSAALMLRETTLPIAEIAARCGFWDAAHLSRQFSCAYAMPPTKWRAVR